MEVLTVIKQHVHVKIVFKEFFHDDIINIIYFVRATQINSAFNCRKINKMLDSDEKVWFT